MNLLQGYNPKAGQVNLLYGGGDNVAVSTEQQCAQSGGTWDPINQVCIPRERSEAEAANQVAAGVNSLPGQAQQLNNSDIDYSNGYLASNGQNVGLLDPRYDPNYSGPTHSSSDFGIGSSQQPTDYSTAYALPGTPGDLRQNEVQAVVNTGYDVGQVDPRLAQAAGYKEQADQATALQNGNYGVALDLGATPEQVEAAGGPSVPVIAKVIAKVLGESNIGKVISAITGKSITSVINNSAARGEVLRGIRDNFENNPAPVAEPTSTTNSYIKDLEKQASTSSSSSNSSSNSGPSLAQRTLDRARASQAAQVARDNNETGRTDSSGNETYSSKVLRGGGFNMGGHVPSYNEGGNLLNHPFEREGEQFDTVPANLTEGEFVIDSDSTHVFQPILEKINQWEPGQDVKLGGLLSQKGEKMTITKDLGNGRKMSVTSGEDDEMMTADAEMMLSTDTQPNLLMSGMEPQGLNQGGTLRDLLGGLSGSSSYDKQRAAALKAAQAKARGAGLNAGLQGLGRSLDNQAAQVGSAGFRTNSLGSFGPNGYQGANFSSRNAPETNFGSQLQAIGQGQQEIGNANANYQNQLSSIAGAEAADLQSQTNRAEDRANSVADDELNRERELADREAALQQGVDEGLDKDKKAQGEAVKLARRAGGLIQKASVAGDIINGHRLVQEVEQEAETAAGQLYDQFKSGIATAGNVLAGGLTQTDRIRGEARARYAQSIDPESYSAYTQLKAITSQMVFPILSTGALGVNPTDADVELAKASQFDVTAPSSTWADQLNAMLTKNGEQGSIGQVVQVTDKTEDKEVPTPEMPTPVTETPSAPVVETPAKTNTLSNWRDQANSLLGGN